MDPFDKTNKTQTSGVTGVVPSSTDTGVAGTNLSTPTVDEPAVPQEPVFGSGTGVTSAPPAMTSQEPVTPGAVPEPEVSAPPVPPVSTPSAMGSVPVVGSTNSVQVNEEPVVPVAGGVASDSSASPLGQSPVVSESDEAGNTGGTGMTGI